MKILLATSNSGKTKEIKEFLTNYEIYALHEVMEPFEIEETGTTFKQNAIIKSNAVFEKLKQMGLDNEFITLSDDSGISIEALNWLPGVYSARYSCSDNEIITNRDDIGARNRLKVIKELHERNLKESFAFYTACMAVSTNFGVFSAHGFMYGKVIDEQRGDHGFGYDYMFIPNGFDKTIGQLQPQIKAQISHRIHALKLLTYILSSVNKVFNSYKA